MTDELRGNLAGVPEAIRWVVEYLDDRIEDGSISPRCGVELRALIESVRASYHGENRADDHKAVDGEWLRAVGFKEMTGPRSEPGEFRLGILEVYAKDCSTNFVGWGDDPDLVGGPDVPTRGYVRRLCRALGIPLAEPPTETST